MLIKRRSIEKEASQRKSSSKNRRIKFAPITLSESSGIRYLHFGTEWIQGAMRMSKPNQLVLSYSHKMVAWMLFNQHPKMIAHLGLGSASLTKFCYTECPDSVTHVAEINPEVIAVCHSMFALPHDNDRLNVHLMDAFDFVSESQYVGAFDIMHVDLYDAESLGPVLSSPEFYANCYQCLKDDGIMAVNLFGELPSYDKNIQAIKRSFIEVVPLSPVPEGNVIVLAFKKKPKMNWTVWDDEANHIKEKTGLPTRQWIKDLKRIWKDD